VKAPSVRTRERADFFLGIRLERTFFYSIANGNDPVFFWIHCHTLRFVIKEPYLLLYRLKLSGLKNRIQFFWLSRPMNTDGIPLIFEISFFLKLFRFGRGTFRSKHCFDERTNISI